MTAPIEVILIAAGASAVLVISGALYFRSAEGTFADVI
jgi:hypothetical protein